MQQAMQQHEQQIAELTKQLEDKNTEFQLEAEKLRIAEEDNKMGHAIDEKQIDLKYDVDTNKVQIEAVKTMQGGQNQGGS